MRHRKTVKKLSRDKDSRRALLKNLAENLILYEKISTTEAKAKAVRSFAERLITKSKNDTLANRRYLIKHLQAEKSVKKLLEVIGPRYKDRSGGYTRIIKLKNRQGDNAPLVQIELV